jgi:hypothetical protein
MASVSWRAHPDIMSMLYKSLVRSILEYGCLAFDRMAENHMLKLERIQYQCLRIALGIMQSTHVQTVEIIAGVEPLRLRYSMLNQWFLTNVLSSASHPLKQKLSELQLMGSPKIIWAHCNPLRASTYISRLTDSLSSVYALEPRIISPKVPFKKHISRDLRMYLVRALIVHIFPNSDVVWFPFLTGNSFRRLQ